MRRFRRCIVVALGLVAGLGRGASAQRVHEVLIEADADREVYAFTPALVVARPGDLLVFRAGRGAPHGVVFEGGGLSAEARSALNAAMGRRSGDLGSAPLAAPGARFRMAVPALPPGDYPFFCLPHRAYDERGTLRVTK